MDANKKVYVYNPTGGLLGSWTAGSLAANAQVEGIATNGTDVWIVDAKQDKVFRYTGAASRLSGSQNAASSFNLNSGNANPKDIVTDGTQLWVVNDATTDKVFKYTLAGVAARQLDDRPAAGGSPTGITLDPANVGHLWIVDSGTDRVYQYDNAGRPHLRLAVRRRRASPWPPATPTRRASPTRPRPPTTPVEADRAGSVVLVRPLAPAAPPFRDGTLPAAPAVVRGGPADPWWTHQPTAPAVEAGPATSRKADQAGAARVGADWFPADEFDLAPVVVDHPVRRPRRA